MKLFPRLKTLCLPPAIFLCCALYVNAQESCYSGAFVHNEGSLTSSSSWQAFTNFETDSGKPVSIINYFQSWANGSSGFPGSTLDNIRAHGSMPLLTWQPEGSVADSNYTLSKIINGNFDDYITSWALAAKAWGHPFFLRFAHEMNGNWYPWCESVNDNSPGQYTQMWQHVHDIFTAVGATNVTWVWCVSTEGSGAYPITGLYPGDNYVDWISLDSYNRKANSWQDFSTHSATTLADIINDAPGKPIMVAESGCSEKTGYDKGQWFRNALANYLKLSMPRIKAWVYFNTTNQNDGNDWSIETSLNAQTNYNFCLSLSYYSDNSYGSISDSPIQPLLNDATGTDTMPPFVSIVSPAMNHVRTNTQIEIRALASDKSGITNVIFSVNGVPKQTTTIAPYRYVWTVPGTAGQNYTLTAKAYDGAGNTTTSIVQVVSQNAVTVTLTNSDPLGSSSFLAPGNWDSGQMPMAGNDYIVPPGLTFRTPTDQSQPFSFAGDSLTLAGTFAFKMTNIITVPDLRLTNGTIVNQTSGGNPAMGRLDGSITVLTNGTIDAGGFALHIMAAIRGNGGLTILHPGAVYLSGNASAYTGTMTNLSSAVEIWSGAANPFGSGRVILMNSTNSLTFNATNDLVIPAAITGAGYIIKQNLNTVTLTGSNTFTGGTTLNGGAIQIAGSLRGSVTNGGGTVIVAGGGNLFATNLIVGLNSLNCINNALPGATVSVGSGSTHSLLVGYRTVSTTGVSAFGRMDVSALSDFTANVGNLFVGVNANSGGTGASVASGQLLLATNNTITATNFLIGSSPGSPSGSNNIVILGSGNNVITTPILIIGGPKESGTLNLNSGGSLFLNNGAGRTDMTIGGENFGTSVTPLPSTANLSGGTFIANLGALTIGLKAGGTSGGDIGALILGNSANDVNVNTLVLGSMSGATSGSPIAQGALTLGGGNFLVNSNVTLGSFSGGFGSATGTLNLNGGTFAVGGNIVAPGGAGIVNVSGATLVLSNQAAVTALNVTNATLRLNINGNSSTTNIAATTISASGTTMIAIDSVVNVSGQTTIPLISYGGANPFVGFALAALPDGYSGNLVDNSANKRIDLNISPSAPSSPMILSPLINGTDLQFQIGDSQSGFNYILESTSRLAPANWTPVQTNAGGGTLTFTIPINATNVQQFFRIRVQ